VGSIHSGEHHESRLGVAFVEFDLLWLRAIELRVEVARLRVEICPRVSLHSVVSLTAAIPIGNLK
jgi:hypothetical protein